MCLIWLTWYLETDKKPTRFWPAMSQQHNKYKQAHEQVNKLHWFLSFRLRTLHHRATGTLRRASSTTGHHGHVDTSQQAWHRRTHRQRSVVEQELLLLLFAFLHSQSSTWDEQGRFFQFLPYCRRAGSILGLLSATLPVSFLEEGDSSIVYMFRWGIG